MKIVRTVQELRDEIVTQKSVGLVPTMGAFHDGHLELMRRCAAENDTTVVSLFVNPLQFGPNEDFERYPRNEHNDAEMAAGAGADILFVPGVEEIVPDRTVSVHVAGVSEKWEGEARPGHFDGVATIVLKLFDIARPRVAYFGLKDLQQCAVIKRMVKELFVPCQLEFVETVREPDGLARSSRNHYLSPLDRERAPILYKSITEAAELIARGDGDTGTILSSCENRLHAAGFLPDYVALVDPEDMEVPVTATKDCRVIAAARLGAVRLIDNVALPNQ